MLKGAILSAILGAIVVFWLLSAGAQSQEPSPDKSQKSPATQERAAEQRVLVIKVLPADKTEADLDAEKAKQKSDGQLVVFTGDLAKYTKLLFVATGLLFLGTGCLVVLGICQGRDNRRMIAATSTAANAAQSSAQTAQRALIELEAPILYVKVTNPGIGIDERENTFEFHRLKYRIVNCGRTPALLTNVEEQFCPMPKGGGFPAPLVPTRTTFGHGVYVPPNEESDEFEVNLFGRYLFDPGAPDDAIMTELFLSVFVRFTDIFAPATAYTVGALFMLDKAFLKFVLTSVGADHNYMRKDQPAKS